MVLGSAARYFACIIFLLCIVPAITTGASPVRTISPLEDQGRPEYIMTITLPSSGIWGISDHLSPGMSFEGTGVPEGSYKYADQHLEFALIDSNTVEYTISMADGDSGEISGEWTNMLTGETGDLPSAVFSKDGGIVISGTPVTGQGYDDADPTPAAPLSPVNGLAAIGIAGALFLIWGRRQ
jgi:hypothetical protein